MAKLDGGFECDRPQKELIKKLINKLFAGYVIKYDEENDSNKMAPIDLVFTAFTKDNVPVKKYAIELKQRLKQHTDYDGDWVVNDEKYEWLHKYNDSGYCSYYLNTFDDGYYALWSLGAIDKYHTEDTFWIKPHTQSQWAEKRIPQHRLIINIKYASRLERYDKYRDN